MNLWALLTGAGLQADANRKSDLLDRYVLATGDDGYRAVFSLGELHPEFGNKPSLVTYAEMLNGASNRLSGTDDTYRVTAV